MSISNKADEPGACETAFIQAAVAILKEAVACGMRLQMCIEAAKAMQTISTIHDINIGVELQYMQAVF